VSNEGENGQLALLPPVAPSVRRAKLRVEELLGWEHARPSPRLLELIRNLGPLEPIVVADPGHHGPRRQEPYPIVEGRRRAKAVALLAAERDGAPARIEALIVSGAGTERAAVLAALALALHASRGDSPASELAAIEAIIATAGETSQAATIKQIAAQTGMPTQTIKRRLRLRNLVPELRGAFDQGKLTPSVAEAAARRSGEQQAELALRLDDGERLTLDAVRELARSQRTTAVGQLPGGLFAERQTPWQATVVGHIKAARDASSRTMPATSRGTYSG
jgi:hypothetical protein